MPQRKQKQQALEEMKDEDRGLSQDLARRLANRLVDAIEEGINEFRRSQMENEKGKGGVAPLKEKGINRSTRMNKGRIEEGISESSKNLKRKRDEGKSKYEGDQLKKNKVEACKNCKKKHAGTCLKGKGVCYICGQGGHIAPQCPKSKKSGCFECGAPNHHKKECPRKKKANGGSSDPTPQVGN